jgi:hypothetical protein
MKQSLAITKQTAVAAAELQMECSDGVCGLVSVLATVGCHESAAGDLGFLLHGRPSAGRQPSAILLIGWPFEGKLLLLGQLDKVHQHLQMVVGCCLLLLLPG